MNAHLIAEPHKTLLKGQNNTGRNNILNAINKIKIGKQNRNDVSEVLGTPSTLGTFDDKVWYYISRKTEKFAFFREQIIDHQVIAIYFDDRNFVAAIHRYNKDDLREIGMVDRTTPTTGKTLSIFKQLIGNMGRFGGN